MTSHSCPTYDLEGTCPHVYGSEELTPLQEILLEIVDQINEISPGLPVGWKEAMFKQIERLQVESPTKE